MIAALTTLNAADIKVANYALKREPEQHVQELQCEARRRQLPGQCDPPAAFIELARAPGVLEWEWKD